VHLFIVLVVVSFVSLLSIPTRVEKAVKNITIFDYTLITNLMH